MGIHLGKFVHTETGKIVMSILLGLGLASLFRSVCKGKGCLTFRAAPFDEFKDKIYKNLSGKCVKYNQVSSKCDINTNTKVMNFE